MIENHDATRGRSLRVFLCHSSADKPPVRSLYQRLLAEGFNPWLDEESLLPGQLWEHEIPKAVKGSHVVIVCLSSKSVTAAGYVQKEIRHALDAADEQPEGAIFIVPLKLDECKLPDRLARWHCVGLFEERGYESLLKALRARAQDLQPIHAPASPTLDAADINLAGPFWGVTYIDIDEEQLTKGTLVVRSCRGMFPNGMRFRIPEGHPPAARIEIERRFPLDRDRLRVFLLSRPATSAESQQELAVGFEGELDSTTMSIAIAQIRRAYTTGEFVLDPSFIPPCITIATSPALLTIVQRLLDLMHVRIEQVGVRRQQRSLETTESAGVAQFLFLQTLSSYAPEFRHIFLMRACHPEQLFVTMLRLAGSLAAFSLETSPLTFPTYDHDDLGSCFSLLDRQILAFLETVVPSRCVIVPILPVGHHVWRGSIPQARLTAGSRLFLGVTAKMALDSLIKGVPRMVKLSGSAEELQHLIRLSLSGRHQLRHEPVPPAEIPLKLNKQYFAIDLREELRQQLHDTGMLHIFVPNELREPELELLIVAEA